MNNEEKILQALTQMQGAISGIQGDVSGLKTDVSSLKEGQAKLEQRFDKLDSKMSNIDHAVIRIENQHGDMLRALFDGREIINDNMNIIKEEIEYLKTISDRNDMSITMLENKGKHQ